MSFFGLMILFLGFARLMRMRRPRSHRRFHYIHGGHWQQRPSVIVAQVQVPAPAAESRETAYEALKRRYVDGEISDERYERELDDLLQTPEGRRQV